MNVIKKAFVGIIATGALVATSFFTPMALAQGILPGGAGNCNEVLNSDNPLISNAYKSKEGLIKYMQTFQGVLGKGEALNNLLGCAIKTGRIHLFMLPFLVTYLIQFLLDLAGLVAVLFIVYGGFKYVVGGVSEDKEAGKKAITQAIVGLVVSLAAWMVVNLIQIALT